MATGAVMQQETRNDNQGLSGQGDEVFMGSLKRFFYIRCNDSFDFLAALKTLHAKVKRLSESGINSQLLMIDSINAFYWLDRAVSSVPLPGQGAGRTALSLQVVSEAVVQELNQLLQTHSLLILATKSLIYGINARDRKSADKSKESFLEEMVQQNVEKISNQMGQFVLRDFMPAVWQGFVSHRLILQGPFEPGASQTFCGENLPFFTAEWESPCLKQVDKLIIEDAGIRLHH